MNAHAEFDRQVDTLIQKGYPELAGLSVEGFLKYVNPLKEKLMESSLPELDIQGGTLPFTIVINSELVDTQKMMSRVNREGKQGLTKLHPHEPKDFAPIDTVTIPDGMAYFLVNIDRGKQTLNITPHDALQMIQMENRSPLTINEGVALVTHFPEFLIKNNCFSLLASRHSGDKRVPAIWINSHKEPNLGWCWNGNPHTWLGSASCEKRIGAQ